MILFSFVHAHQEFFGCARTSVFDLSFLFRMRVRVIFRIRVHSFYRAIAIARIFSISDTHASFFRMRMSLFIFDAQVHLIYFGCACASLFPMRTCILIYFGCACTFLFRRRNFKSKLKSRDLEIICLNKGLVSYNKLKLIKSIKGIICLYFSGSNGNEKLHCWEIKTVLLSKSLECLFRKEKRRDF